MVRPGGARHQSSKLASHWADPLFPTGNDLAIGSKSLQGGFFSVLVVELEDFHALLGDFAFFKLPEAMEHIIRPPIAFNFIKQTPYLHGSVIL